MKFCFHFHNLVQNPCENIRKSYFLVHLWKRSYLALENLKFGCFLDWRKNPGIEVKIENIDMKKLVSYLVLE